MVPARFYSGGKLETRPGFIPSMLLSVPQDYTNAKKNTNTNTNAKKNTNTDLNIYTIVSYILAALLD